ncbi:MAG: flavin reductase family protein [Pseudomonadota bacterium]
MDQSRAFRDALAQYPTGVAVVTIASAEGPRAMTINSFASVSLDPALILWSVAKDSERWRSFRDAPVFAVNVLAADQAAVASACARNDALDESGAPWRQNGEVAVLDGAVAWFECALSAIHPGGDHDIIVGEVTRFSARPDTPALLFHRSQFSFTHKD